MDPDPAAAPGTGEPPARDRLAQVAADLARRLPERLGELLASDRFADGRGALDRLAVPGAAGAAAAGLGDAEACRLTDLLLARWAAVAAALDPEDRPGRGSSP